MPNDNPVSGQPAEAVAHDLPTASGEVSGSGPGEFLGYTIRETGGTSPLTVVLYDNASAGSGNILAEIEVLAGKQTDEMVGRPGKQVVNGIYAVISGGGTLQGAIYQ